MDPRRAEALAQMLTGAYDDYVRDFHAITRMAQGRFEARDWTGSVHDSLARLRLYKRHIDDAARRSHELVGPDVFQADLWDEARSRCRGLLESRYDADLALMFVDSVKRRELTEAAVPYGHDSVDRNLDPRVQERIVATYRQGRGENLSAVVERILRDCAFRVPYRRLSEDARASAQAIEESAGPRSPGDVLEIDVLRPLFYRNKGAYVVGRTRLDGRVLPLALALGHSRDGLVVDAVLTEESDLRRIFSYTRSNFHVEVEGQYREVLEFLRSVMPHKNWAALYSSIGFMNPAKIQLSKDLEAHRQRPGTRLTAAWGIPGLVMVVFTSPGFPYVFKVIRDDDKVTKRRYVGSRGVAERYRLVQEGDRVGRLLDTITFHHLRFRRDDFEPKILRELLDTASESVKESGDEIIITRCYAQRDAIPLPIYLHQSDWPEIERVLGDLGWCLKQIAAVGLFPGEFDLKNFGVAEDGRVVFFDFDGLDELRNFSFDHVPLAASLGQEEIFEYLLNAYRVNLIDVFSRLHPDLFSAEHWRHIQSLLGQGEVLDTFPYPEHKRLEARAPSGTSDPPAIPPAVDRELERLGVKSAHRRGLIAWQAAGTGLTIGRARLDMLNADQDAVVRQTFGASSRATAQDGIAVILVEGVPAFVYLPELSKTVVDLCSLYAIEPTVAEGWRGRVTAAVLQDGRHEFRAPVGVDRRR